MSKPTHQDALVYLQFMRWQEDIGFEAASDFMWSDDFPLTFAQFDEEIKDGTPEQKYTAVYAEALETIAAFHKHGLIHQDLLFDLNSFQNSWERFKDIIVGYREKNNLPKFMECFEKLVEAEKRAEDT